MALFLKNATFIDWQTLEFKETSIRVEEGLNGGIQFVNWDAHTESDTLLDCKGKLVTKSFACGHHHIYSALARGMGAPKKTPRNFHEVLKYIWWTLDKCLNLEMIKASALCTAVFCAKNGVTFVIDHHASPFAVENSLPTIAAAFEQVGIGHLLCYELSDRDGRDVTRKGLEETENYLKNGSQGLVGLHASFTVGDLLLNQAADLVKKYNSGIHVHVAEDQMDQDNCIRDYHKRVITRYHDAGLLNSSRTILAHCIHLDDAERELVRQSRAYVVQNAESNLNNNVGFFNQKGMGERMMLGTDGMHSDMLRSAKSAYLLGQSTEGITMDTIYKRFRMVHHYVQENHFHGDGANNLVILDYDSSTEINTGNFTGHFVYGIEAKHIESVIANGRLIVKDRKITTVNEDDIFNFSREMGKELWTRMNESNFTD